MRLRRLSVGWLGVVLTVWLGLVAGFAAVTVEQARERAAAAFNERATAARRLVTRYAVEQDGHLTSLAALVHASGVEDDAFARVALAIMGACSRIVSVRIVAFDQDRQARTRIAVPDAVGATPLPVEARLVFGQRMGETGAYAPSGWSGRYLLGRRAGEDGLLAVLVEIDAARLVPLEEQPENTRLALSLGGRTLVERQLPWPPEPGAAVDALSFEGPASSGREPLQLALSRAVRLADLADPVPAATFATGALLVLLAVFATPFGVKRARRGRQALRRVAERNGVLERAARRAEAERQHLLGAFASGVAHHLGPPLAVIRARSEQGLRIAGREGVPAPVAAALEACLGEAGRAEDVLLRMRREVERAAADPALADLNALVSTAVERARADIANLGIRLSVDLEAPLPPVLVDALAIEDALALLLRHAAERLAGMPQEERQIMVHTLDMGDSLLARVGDTGAGLDDASLATLFEPPLLPLPDGPGLDLPLCATLVAQAGGTVTAQSEAGEGAWFVVTLPVAIGRRRAAQ